MGNQLLCTVLATLHEDYSGEIFLERILCFGRFLPSQLLQLNGRMTCFICSTVFQTRLYDAWPGKYETFYVYFRSSVFTHSYSEHLLWLKSRLLIYLKSIIFWKFLQVKWKLYKSNINSIFFLFFFYFFLLPSEKKNLNPFKQNTLLLYLSSLYLSILYLSSFFGCSIWVRQPQIHIWQNCTFFSQHPLHGDQLAGRWNWPRRAVEDLRRLPAGNGAPGCCALQRQRQVNHAPSRRGISWLTIPNISFSFWDLFLK